MFPIRLDSLEELRGIARVPIILPGEREPDWLFRKAEYARILRDSKTAPAARTGGPRFVQKLRLVLARG